MGLKDTTDIDASLPAEATEADNVLLLGPETDGPAVSETCVGLLACKGLPDTSVLTVALVDSPEDRLESWFHHEDELPVRMQYLSDSSGGEDLPQSVEVTRLSNPRDLPRLGITLVDMIEELATGEAGIALCFRSLTALLQYAEAQQVFRFIHTLDSRTGSYGLRTHFHLDPDIVDEQTITTLESLFDAVVEVDADGQARVR